MNKTDKYLVAALTHLLEKVDTLESSQAFGSPLSDLGIRDRQHIDYIRQHLAGVLEFLQHLPTHSHDCARCSYDQLYTIRLESLRTVMMGQSCDAKDEMW